MSLTAFQSKISETEARFRSRNDDRANTTRSLERGDVVSANDDELVRKRLLRLGVGPALTEAIGTRSFSPPRIIPEGDTRAVINSLILERILGKNDLMPISFLLLGQHRARSVGRITIKNQNGQRVGFGTGFLVSPRLLLTNNHVLETASMAQFSEIEFDFEVDLSGRVRKTISFPLDPATFFLTDEKLDFSLVAVLPNTEARREPSDWGWNRLIEGDSLIVKGESVSIIQHPNGETKQIALRENNVIDLFDDFAHYKTDTAPGSSGSPVFNDQWELVALHHSGVPKRDTAGRILTNDDKVWTEAMGEHRIQWIANEGIFGSKIVNFVKQATLTGAAVQLRDELMTSVPPLPEGLRQLADTAQGKPKSVPSDTSRPIVIPTPAVTPVAASTSQVTSNGVSWTIPLQVTISLGAPASQSSAMPVIAPPPVTVPPDTQPSPVPSVDDPDTKQALAQLAQARERTYYDSARDDTDRTAYYATIDPNDLSPNELYGKLNLLLTSTHSTKPKYKPSSEVYPWVDLHPDLKLRSIYSGNSVDAEEFIREDLQIQQERNQHLQEMVQREANLSAEMLQEQLDLLEAQNPFNCEHVVPQSWFGKQEPMRGDLHHLFACEYGCNSFRGNIPYFDFTDFEEALRTACGKRETNKFEPSAGKGAVARATLYFLLRYPSKINNSAGELDESRIATLLAWHSAFPVDNYERHRNQAIFDRQGNRNPLIDHPDWVGKVNFSLGLG